VASSREDWLTWVVNRYRPWFQENGIYLPPRINISVGWPSTGVSSGTIAESWPRAVSKDRSNSIFISPQLHDSREVLTVICHELTHVALDCEYGHQKEFQSLAKRVGLLAPWRQSVASDRLLGFIDKTLKSVGDYPHSGIKDNAVRYTTVQKSYLLKVECLSCGYLLRGTKTWLSKAIPDCPVCHTEMAVMA
jgi:hypothetical protein